MLSFVGSWEGERENQAEGILSPQPLFPLLCWPFGDLHSCGLFVIKKGYYCLKRTKQKEGGALKMTGQQVISQMSKLRPTKVKGLA